MLRVPLGSAFARFHTDRPSRSRIRRGIQLAAFAYEVIVWINDQERGVLRFIDCCTYRAPCQKVVVVEPIEPSLAVVEFRP